MRNLLWLAASVAWLCAGCAPDAPRPDPPHPIAETPPPSEVGPADSNPRHPVADLPPARPWLDSGPTDSGIGRAEGRALARYAAALLDGKAPADLPGSLQNDQKVRMVFVSAGDGRQTALSAWACRRGIGPAIRDAASALAERSNAREGFVRRGLRLDIVRLSAQQAELGKSAAELFGPGLTGLAGQRGSRLALCPGQVWAAGIDQLAPATALQRQLLRSQTDMRTAGDIRRQIQSGGYALMTRAWFLAGRKVWELYRGHRRFAQPTPDQLRQAALAGRDYLVAGVGPDGRFAYAYDPIADKPLAGYNILRHAGTVFALCQTHALDSDEDSKAAIDRAVTYLLAQIRPAGDVKNAVWLVEDREVKLGGHGLAILALAHRAETFGDRKHLETMQALARWIVATQEESGRFGVHKYELEEGRARIDRFRSLYYPGEAIFGLMRLYRLDGNALWLDVADRAARYRLSKYAGLPDSSLPHDHWLLYGLAELYRDRPRPEYLKFAIRLTNVILASQKRHHVYLDWQGAFRIPASANQTATRCEGLAAAWKMMRQARRPDQADRIAEALALGVQQVLGMQLRIDSAMFLPDPAQARGGFFARFEDPAIRIDHVQHSISALLGYRDVLAGKHPKPHRQPGR